MYLASYPHFRHYFAEMIRETLTISFATSDAGVMIRGAGSFIADGFLPGMRLGVVGSASNDRMYTINVVNALTMSFLPNDYTVGEAGVTVAIEAGFYDNDGYARWPVEKLRVNGFGDSGSTITQIPRPVTHRAYFRPTCNAFAADAVPGTDDYDWYLSQRTDDPAKQRLSIKSLTSIGSPHASGTAVIRPLPDDNTVISPEQLVDYFKHCHLYVQRRSDKAIQWVDLYQYMVGRMTY